MPASEKIPSHLSAEEHALLVAEEELLKDGGQWLKRAAKLYTETPKVKIWVPVLGSLLVTVYYLYSIHNAMPAAAGQGVTASPAFTQTAQTQTAQTQTAQTQATEPMSTPVAVPEPDNTPAATGATGSSTSGSGKGPASGGPITDEPEATDADLIQRAQQAHGSQQFAEEARLLQKVLDHSQASGQVCPAIGKAYERAGQIDSAIQALDQCLALAPGDVDIHLALAHVLQAKPDFSRASLLYRQALQKDPGNLDAQTGMALLELKQNHLHEADTEAAAILHKAPENTDALLISGLVAWRQSRLADAQRIFSRGAALDDRRADFHAFLGRIAEAQRRPQDALEQYEKALTLEPGDADVADRAARLRDAK